MLANLKIENVAVIEKAEVNFTPGFNVLTGETGAGKSILIDSINAILGNRTSRELVRSGAQKACIWATFENIPQSVKKQLEKCGYEANDDLLLYREINAEGKGSCRVNGMPATAAVVRDISAGLLSIHGQHDSQSLTNPALHLGLLDQYAQNRDLFADYYRRYRELVTVKRQLDALNASEAYKQRKIEALTAEIDAIDAAALQPGEEKNLQERKTVITHAQGILDGITAAHLALAGDEDGEQPGAADLLGGAVEGLQNSARLDETLAPLSERLNDLYYSARALATELADRLDAYGFDPGELDMIESRLDTIYRIKQKFGMEVEELLARREAAAAELENFQSSGQKIAELKTQVQALYGDAKKAAEALTQSRLKGFTAMNKEMRASALPSSMHGGRCPPTGRIRWNSLSPPTLARTPSPWPKSPRAVSFPVLCWRSRVPWPTATPCPPSSTMRSTPVFPAWRRGASASCCTRQRQAIRCFASPIRRRWPLLPITSCSSRKTYAMTAPLLRSIPLI